MLTSEPMPDAIRFGSFEVDIAARQLRKRGVPVHLRDKSFLLLLLLLDRPGAVVTREDLRTRLWPSDVFVDFDNNLNAAMAALRQALGESADRPRFVETLPRLGYRFIAPVETVHLDGESDEARPARLVVLPLLNLAGDPAQEYFSDAMTEDLTTELAALTAGRLGVIARTTAMRYKKSRKAVAQIGQELRVQYLVEGGVRLEGDRVAITVQLIRVGDQTHIFAQRYETGLGDLFAVRNRIAEALSAALGLPDAPGAAPGRLSAPRRKKPTDDVAAYREYMHGRHEEEAGTPDGMAKAMEHFQSAIARDPNFALAHAALADLWSSLGFFGYVRPIEAFSTGIWHAVEAARLDDGLAEAHAALADFHKQLEYDWPAARREMARALELNPASPTVRVRHAVTVLLPEERLEEAIAEIELALDLDPLSAGTRAWLGIMRLYARNYDGAIEEAQRLLDLEPASCWAQFIIGIAYRQKYADLPDGGRERPEFARRAIGALETAANLAPGSDFFLGWLGHALGVCGREEEARGALERLYALRQAGKYVLPTNFAWTYFGLGDIDATFEWLDRAVDERDQMIIPILSYAHLDPLRGDARFAALLGKMKLDRRQAADGAGKKAFVGNRGVP